MNSISDTEFRMMRPFIRAVELVVIYISIEFIRLILARSKNLRVLLTYRR